ncbi:LexA family protein [Myxococcus sp. Y35]|uniref:LexA family protein n=1 Tax=Pseudomyxococcus flavus TaxID=3115648 RepID=UPI003CEBD663
MTCPAPNRPPRRPPPEHGAHGEPTARQLEVLAFVHLHQVAFERAPSTHELCARFGWASTNSSADYLQRLAGHGLLTRTPGIARGLRLTAAGRAAAQDYLRTHLLSPLLSAVANTAVQEGATP